MIQSLLRNNIAALSPYSTARDEYQGELGIYLDANENPYNNGYNRYPDPYQRELKQKIALKKGINPENLFLGNGSDEAIDLLYRIFCEPTIDNVVAICPTYGMYRVAAAINNVEYREVMLEEADFSLDTTKLLAQTDAHTKLLFICSPNNPTANALPASQIRQIITQFSGIVVLDEAYIDFSSEESFAQKSYPNLVILQTLSKAWAMAGLRLGLAIAPQWVIRVMTNVKYPYNINVVTQKIVLEQLDHDITPQIQQIITERSRIIKALSECPVVRKIYPSDANFVLIRVDEPRAIYDTLIQNGIIVRDRSRIALCGGCLRITIGTPSENDQLIQTIKQL